MDSDGRGQGVDWRMRDVQPRRQGLREGVSLRGGADVHDREMQIGRPAALLGDDIHQPGQGAFFGALLFTGLNRAILDLQNGLDL